MNNELDSSNFREVLSQDRKWLDDWQIDVTIGLITHSSGLKFSFASKPDCHGTQCEFYLLTEGHYLFRDADHIIEFSQLGLQATFLMEEYSDLVSMISDDESPEQSDATPQNDDYVHQLIKNLEWQSDWSVNRVENTATHSSGLIFQRLNGEEKTEFSCINYPDRTDREFKKLYQDLVAQALFLLFVDLNPDTPTELEPAANHS